MFSLEALGAFLEQFIKETLAEWASVSAYFVLLSEPGADLDSRVLEPVALDAKICDFKGYAQVPADQGGEESVWLPIETNGLAKRTQQLSAAYAYNSAGVGDDNRTLATHVALVADTGAARRYVKVWEIDEPVDFNEDGVSHTFRMRLSDINAEDHGA